MAKERKLLSAQEEARALLQREDAETRIKTCGMFRPQDIAAVNEARPDLVGFIVDFPKSHRSVASQQLARLAQLVDTGIFKVGVFVDAPLETIGALADAGTIDIAQLHGHEDDAYLAALRQRTGIGIIQAFQVHTAEDVTAAQTSTANMVLLDAGQGSGQAFDWTLVQSVNRPFMLAGGLTPKNVAQAISAVHPWGVDLSSGLETNKLKDPAKIQAAVGSVKRG